MYVSIAEEQQPVKKRQSVPFAVSDMARWIQTIIPEISSGLRPQRPTNRNINAVERQSLQKEDHQWKNGVCKTCNYACKHSGGTATCKEKAVCAICGIRYGEPDWKNHSNLKRSKAQAATITKEGNIEYWYCDGCNKYYSDKNAAKEIRKADTVIAKLKSDPNDQKKDYR